MPPPLTLKARLKHGLGTASWAGADRGRLLTLGTLGLQANPAGFLLPASEGPWRTGQPLLPRVHPWGLEKPPQMCSVFRAPQIPGPTCKVT